MKYKSSLSVILFFSSIIVSTITMASSSQEGTSDEEINEFLAELDRGIFRGSAHLSRHSWRGIQATSHNDISLKIVESNRYEWNRVFPTYICFLEKKDGHVFLLDEYPCQRYASLLMPLALSKSTYSVTEKFDRLHEPSMLFYKQKQNYYLKNIMDYRFNISLFIEESSPSDQKTEKSEPSHRKSNYDRVTDHLKKAAQNSQN